jgi:hypothetical protein
MPWMRDPMRQAALRAASIIAAGVAVIGGIPF